MKKYLFWGISLFLLCFACTKSDKTSTKAVLSLDKDIKVLYLGVDNPVSIAVAGVSAGEISVKTDDPCRLRLSVC